MNKLKSFLTKRIIKQLKEEAEKDPVAYQRWFEEFNSFIKEGSIDPDYKKDVV